MRTAIVTVSLTLVAFLAPFALAEGDATRIEPRHNVLVELFTSQG